MLTFLKLGGSLITDKAQPRTVRRETLTRLMAELAVWWGAQPQAQLVLGHGSGSFGHSAAKKYGTRQGVRTPEAWRGYAEVQAVANLLNREVVDAARAAGLPVLNCPPSASAVCRDGELVSLALAPIEAALAHGLLPVVQGDVALDEARGGTIVSTEDVFRYLAPRLKPQRILLAGIEPGVLDHWPGGAILPELREVPGSAGASAAADVTGGMAAKIRETLGMLAGLPACEARIFSGEAPGAVLAALHGEPLGTRLLGE
jgi:isopentenyl phosphate kinase